MTVIITVSVILNMALAYYSYYLKKQSKIKKNSKELNEFIRDLSQGYGMLMVRVDPDNILLRSPRS